jgi:cytidyltransferase-like protein
MPLPRYGIVLGRFQPFHVGHLEYVEAARRRCQRLIIGITNPDITKLRHHDSDPNRSQRDSNPYPYFVRHEVIEAALLGEGWSCASFAIVPADLDDPARLGAFLPHPRQSKMFVTIYDAWGEEKLRRITDLGFEVEILWRRTMAERATSGAEIRDLMRNRQPWAHLVPTGAAELLAARIPTGQEPFDYGDRS